MKKVKVKDLHGKALVWTMCMVESVNEYEANHIATEVGTGDFNLEELIEHYKVGVIPPDGHRGSQWMAFFYRRTQHDLTLAEGIQGAQFGGTPITAVMRTIIANCLGRVVSVPDELAGDQS